MQRIRLITLGQWISLFFLGLIMRPLITSIYPAISVLSTHFHLSPIGVALFTSIPIFCMGIFAVLAKYISLFVQKEKIILISASIIGLSFLARAYLHQYSIILLFTFLGGIGIGLGGTLITALIKEYFLNKPLSSMGLYTLGIGVGAVLGSVNTENWQMTQAVWASVSLIFCVIWMYFFRLTNEHKEKNSTVFHLKWPLKEKKALLITFLFGLQSFINYSLLTWVGPYYQSVGFQKQSFSVAHLPLVLLTIQLISSWAIPQLLDCFEKSIVPLVVLSFLLMLSMGGLYYCPLSNVSVIMIGLGISTGAIFPLSMSMPMIFIEDTAQCNTWFLMMTSVGYVISGFGPLLSAVIINISNSQKFSILFILICSLIMFLVTILLHVMYTVSVSFNKIRA